MNFVPSQQLASSEKIALVANRFAVSQVLPGIFHLSFIKQKDMTTTFMRFQAVL